MGGNDNKKSEGLKKKEADENIFCDLTGKESSSCVLAGGNQIDFLKRNDKKRICQ